MSVAVAVAVAVAVVLVASAAGAAGAEADSTDAVLHNIGKRTSRGEGSVSTCRQQGIVPRDGEPTRRRDETTKPKLLYVRWRNGHTECCSYAQKARLSKEMDWMHFAVLV
jgi:hypothetical protein